MQHRCLQLQQAARVRDCVRGSVCGVSTRLRSRLSTSFQISSGTGPPLPLTKHGFAQYFLFLAYVQISYLVSGTGIPVGDQFPAGNRDGRKMSPNDLRGDGDGEISPPRGRGWWVNPRRGIPHYHLEAPPDLPYS